ncbi:MAG TPA: ABC transporter permease [Mycobacteriales bacterium]|jgi:ABC-2 type transport system permease protein|nr:ABC transporter permease [Mycobacteriales bacterium]
MSSPGSTRTGTVSLIARREITTRVRERSFQISVAVTLIIIVAVIVILRIVSGGTKHFDVGVSGPQAGALAAAVQATPRPAKTEVSVKTYSDAASARTAVRAGRVDAAFDGGTTVVVKSNLDSRLQSVLDSARSSLVAGERLKQAGIDPGAVAKALDVSHVSVQKLTGGGKNADAKKAIAYIGVILLYGQLIAFGMWVAMGVVEEKSSRVVELLLAAVKPWQLLAGKIIGVGLVGFGQLLLTAIVGLIVGRATDMIQLQAGVVGTVIDVLAWFVLGYAFYACAFAAAGSLVSRQEELQNTVSPLSLLLVASFVLSLQAISNPGGGLARVLSIIPPFSAMIMPPRVAGGAAPGWQIALAVVLMLLAIVALVRLSARIYAAAVLRSGARVRWTDALRAKPEMVG